MSFRLKHASALVAAVCIVLAPVAPQAATPPRAATPLTWPRNFDAASEHVELYQPEIEKWEGNRMSGRAAVAVGAKDGAPTYGVVHFSAIADIDKPSALVQLTQITIESVEVPTRPEAADQVRNALLARLPPGGLTVPLDELQASYAVSRQLASAAKVPVKNDAPQIIFATTPDTAGAVDGDPAWRAVPGTGYERALNSRAMLLREPGGELYLQAAGYWYRSESAGGAWEVMATVPKALQAAATKAAESSKPDAMLPADGKRLRAGLTSCWQRGRPSWWSPMAHRR